MHFLNHEYYFKLNFMVLSCRRFILFASDKMRLK